MQIRLIFSWESSCLSFRSKYPQIFTKFQMALYIIPAKEMGSILPPMQSGVIWLKLTFQFTLQVFRRFNIRTVDRLISFHKNHVDNSNLCCSCFFFWKSNNTETKISPQQTNTYCGLHRKISLCLLYRHSQKPKE